MNSFHRGKTSLGQLVFVAVCFFLVAATLTGCEPLRKKFSRQKKQTKQDEIIPLLEPVEYPAKVYTSGEIYRHRYSLWQVWHKDLMTALQEKESDKSIIYILGQLMVQIDEMQEVVGGPTHAGLALLKQALDKINEEYQKPAGMRNGVIIKNKLIRIDKQMRQQYPPKEITDDLNQD